MSIKNKNTVATYNHNTNPSYIAVADRTIPEGAPTFLDFFPTPEDFATFMQTVAAPYYSTALQTAIKSPELAGWLYDMFLGRYSETYLRYEKTLWGRKFKTLLSNNVVSLIVNNMWTNLIPSTPLTSDMLGETITSTSSGSTDMRNDSNGSAEGTSSNTSNTTDTGTTNSALSNSMNVLQKIDFDPVNEYIDQKQYGSNNVTMNTTSSGNMSDSHLSTNSMTSNRQLDGVQTKTNFVENIMTLEGSNLTMKLNEFLNGFAHIFLKVTGSYETFPMDIWHLK